MRNNYITINAINNYLFTPAVVKSEQHSSVLGLVQVY